MQVFLNEWCLQAQDLHKLEEYIDTLLQKGVKHIYYAKNIEDVITKTLIDDNELSIWLSTFEKIQNKVSVFQTVYEEGINYFVSILNPNQSQITEIGHTAIAQAARKSLQYPKEIIALLHLSNCQFVEYGFCHVIRQDTKNQEITLIKVPVIDSLQKVHLLVGMDFIKREQPNFEKIEQSKSYKEALIEALKFDFDRFIYSQNNLLPLKKLSNFIVPEKYNSWEEWGKEIKKLGTGKGEVNAKNFEFGIKVATMNGYIFSKVTQCNEKKNNKREIYEAGKNRAKIYLSIEFEKPFIFEVFDFNGTHIGELSFDGVLRSQNKHKINVTC